MIYIGVDPGMPVVKIVLCLGNMLNLQKWNNE